MKPKIMYSREAQNQLKALPARHQQYIHCSITGQAEWAQNQMVVRGLTITLPDHIYRAYKLQATHPQYRAIFHFEKKDLVIIDRICARHNDPYSDGH